MSHIPIGIYAITSGSAKEIADLAREGMLPVFRAHPGFKSYGVVETEDGKVVSGVCSSADKTGFDHKMLTPFRYLTD